MIHDAQVEVSCDGEGCTESVYVSPEYVFQTWAASSGFYNTSDEAIERRLQNDHDWTVTDGKHYCEMCTEG